MIFHVAYACDENYIEQTMISMASLMEHNKAHKIVIYLIENRISRGALQGINQLVETYRQTLICVKLDKLVCGMDLALDQRHPKTIYAKLFLTQVCEADRILYLDSDTVVMSSLEELWKMDVTDAYIAGVAMPYADIIKQRFNLASEIDYFCDGILMINLELWRKKGITEQCREFILESNGCPDMLSEGVVNTVAGVHRVTLPPKYNVMSTVLLWNTKQIKELFDIVCFYTQGQIDEARKKPVVIHYLNELFIRPWYRNSDHPFRSEYVEWRKKLGWDIPMSKGKRSLRTKAVLILDKILPFPWFCKVYRMVRKCNR